MQYTKIKVALSFKVTDYIKTPLWNKWSIKAYQLSLLNLYKAVHVKVKLVAITLNGQKQTILCFYKGKLELFFERKFI